MPLKSRLHHPPGGFQFYQAQTDWTAPQWLSFSALVQAVIDHRKANPRFALATDLPQVEREVDEQNASRLKAMRGGEEYIQGDTPPPDFQFPPRQKRDRGGVAAVDSARKAVAGVGVVADWLGDGLTPVDKALAEHRAQTCVLCPLNQEGSFWQKLEAKAAAALRELVNAKNGMNLSTTVDAKLHSCTACDCWNPLKVHVPISHIKSHTRPETFEKLWDRCWVRHEWGSA